MRTSKTAFRPLRTQKVAYTGTAGTITNAIGAGVKVIRVYCTTIAHVRVDKTPTAVATDMIINAGVPEYFNVEGGEKVSAIQDASGGDLYVTEMQ